MRTRPCFHHRISMSCRSLQTSKSYLNRKRWALSTPRLIIQRWRPLKGNYATAVIHFQLPNIPKAAKGMTQALTRSLASWLMVNFKCRPTYNSRQAVLSLAQTCQKTEPINLSLVPKILKVLIDKDIILPKTGRHFSKICKIVDTQANHNPWAWVAMRVQPR